MNVPLYTRRATRVRRVWDSLGASLSFLYEVPLEGVVRIVLAQIRAGAPTGLVAATLLPARLLGALQVLAPDWFTAALCSSWLPGNPVARAAAAKAPRAAESTVREE